MTKSNRRRGNEMLNRMLDNLPNPKPKPDDRLAILAVELGLAGGEVLQRDFNFTQEQTARWLDAMLDQAKVNRVRAAAHLAVQQIDNPAGGQRDKTRKG